MKTVTDDRGRQGILHPSYQAAPYGNTRLAQQSSAVDQTDPSMLNRPGASYLWLGELHHLNRSEVQELVGYLQCWLNTGCLFDAPVDRNRAMWNNLWNAWGVFTLTCYGALFGTFGGMFYNMFKEFPAGWGNGVLISAVIGGCLALCVGLFGLWFLWEKAENDEQRTS